jgi:hypothetical protein
MPSPPTPEVDSSPSATVTTSPDAEGAQSLLDLGKLLLAPRGVAVSCRQQSVAVQADDCPIQEATAYTAYSTPMPNELQEYIHAYFTLVHPLFPILHKASWDASRSAPDLLLAIAWFV